MAGSLQDQLLGAGLIDKKKAKKIKTEKRNTEKKVRKNKVEAPVNEAAILAEKAREEQRRKSQELNELRKHEAEQKAIAAQVRQIIEMNSIAKTGAEEGEAYNFTDNNKVKSIYVSAKNRDFISRGRIAIARLEDSYHLIPAEAANKISERDTLAIVLLNTPQSSDTMIDEDDPYAEFQIPDDLMW